VAFATVPDYPDRANRYADLRGKLGRYRLVRICSVMVAASSSMLSGEVNLRMYNTHVPCQRIVARESLFLNAQCATDLLLACIVDRILVSGKIVRARENGVARLAGGGVDALTLVWTRLRVAL